jgi:hypothetical protein
VPIDAEMGHCSLALRAVEGLVVLGQSAGSAPLYCACGIGQAKGRPERHIEGGREVMAYGSCKS